MRRSPLPQLTDEALHPVSPPLEGLRLVRRVDWRSATTGAYNRAGCPTKASGDMQISRCAVELTSARGRMFSSGALSSMLRSPARSLRRAGRCPLRRRRLREQHVPEHELIQHRRRRDTLEWSPRRHLAEGSSASRQKSAGPRSRLPESETRSCFGPRRRARRQGTIRRVFATGPGGDLRRPAAELARSSRSRRQKVGRRRVLSEPDVDRLWENVAKAVRLEQADPCRPGRIHRTAVVAPGGFADRERGFGRAQFAVRHRSSAIGLTPRSTLGCTAQRGADGRTRMPQHADRRGLHRA